MNIKNMIKKNAHEYGALIALVLLVVVMSLVSPQFRTFTNFLTLLRQASVNGLIAFGMTLVILTGGIDLSVGSTLGLTGALFAGLIVNVGMPIPLAVLVALIFGLGLGWISGFL